MRNQLNFLEKEKGLILVENTFIEKCKKKKVRSKKHFENFFAFPTKTKNRAKQSSVRSSKTLFYDDVNVLIHLLDKLNLFQLKQKL